MFTCSLHLLRKDRCELFKSDPHQRRSCGLRDGARAVRRARDGIRTRQVSRRRGATATTIGYPPSDAAAGLAAVSLPRRSIG